MKKIINGNVIPNRFDFEQKILSAWGIIDEIRFLNERFCDRETFDLDNFCNHISAIETLYEQKFQVLWEQFEEHIKAIDLGVKELENDS